VAGPGPGEAEAVQEELEGPNGLSPVLRTGPQGHPGPHPPRLPAAAVG